MENPVIKNAVIGAKTSPENTCAKCLSSFWWTDEHSPDLHCYCRLINAESWNSRRGTHCNHLCTGNDDPVAKIVDGNSMDESRKSVCRQCENAIWWKDEAGERFCYCKLLFRLTFGRDRKGYHIPYKTDCNGIHPIEDA